MSLQRSQLAPVMKEVPAKTASGSVFFSGCPNALDTLQLGATTWTFVNGAPAAGEIDMSGGLVACIAAAKAVINAESANVYVDDDGVSVLHVVSQTPGVVGNTYAMVESTAEARMYLSAAFLTDGAAEATKLVWGDEFPIGANEATALAAGMPITVGAFSSANAPEMLSGLVRSAAGAVQADLIAGGVSFNLVAMGIGDMYAVTLADSGITVAAGSLISWQAQADA